MGRTRWIVVAAAVGLAGAALFLLLGPDDPRRPPPTEPTERAEAPAMDDIDAESRAAMRKLLREAGSREDE